MAVKVCKLESPLVVMLGAEQAVKFGREDYA